ncbi:MAG: hypothetical protein LBG06_02190 [Deltaproteobacteria bacterium]|jgi:hypothetical protein|nr:hypothetical protein [Deltaproteobacteria bacterium]
MFSQRLRSLAAAKLPTVRKPAALGRELRRTVAWAASGDASCWPEYRDLTSARRRGKQC